jgi:integrase
MPKPKINDEIRCAHHAWLLSLRNRIWYADGRGNTPSAGRHSLGTRDRDEAVRRLIELDRLRAEETGRIPRTTAAQANNTVLPLQCGRELYESYIARPRVIGGVSAATKRKYRGVFNKLLPFLSDHGVGTWNAVTTDVVNRYAAHMEKKGYAAKSIRDDLTTIKQAVRWLADDGHLVGASPIKVKLRKAESQPAYCYREAEVAAMVAMCFAHPKLKWMGNLIIALACTGLRISELVSLRWSDLDLDRKLITIADESGRIASGAKKRRQTKSGRSRTFPIHPDLLQVLPTISRRGASVFSTPKGDQLRDSSVRRVLIREVITPLGERFPTADGELGFKHGRFHSFRHYFCSRCAHSGVPERMVMDWLGHANSNMIRHYYHLHDEEAQRRMGSLDFIGTSSGRSADTTDGNTNGEGADPQNPES